MLFSYKRYTHNRLYGYVVTPEDLAVSKLGRFSTRDEEDILSLLKLKRMTPESFKARAEEALEYYVGNTMSARGSLSQVLRKHAARM